MTMPKAFFSAVDSDMLRVNGDIWHVKRKIRDLYTRDLEQRISRTEYLYAWLDFLLEIRLVIEDRLAYEQVVRKRLLQAANLAV